MTRAGPQHVGKLSVALCVAVSYAGACIFRWFGRRVAVSSLGAGHDTGHSRTQPRSQMGSPPDVHDADPNAPRVRTEACSQHYIRPWGAAGVPRRLPRRHGCSLLIADCSSCRCSTATLCSADMCSRGQHLQTGSFVRRNAKRTIHSCQAASVLSPSSSRPSTLHDQMVRSGCV